MHVFSLPKCLLCLQICWEGIPESTLFLNAGKVRNNHLTLASDTSNLCHFHLPTRGVTEWPWWARRGAALSGENLPHSQECGQSTATSCQLFQSPPSVESHLTQGQQFPWGSWGLLIGRQKSHRTSLVGDIYLKWKPEWLGPTSTQDAQAIGIFQEILMHKDSYDLTSWTHHRSRNNQDSYLG